MICKVSFILFLCSCFFILPVTSYSSETDEQYEPKQFETEDFILRRLNFPRTKINEPNCGISGSFLEFEQKATFSNNFLNVDVSVRRYSYGGESATARWSADENTASATMNINLKKIVMSKKTIRNYGCRISLDAISLLQPGIMKEGFKGKWEFSDYPKLDTVFLFSKEPERVIKAIKHLAKLHGNILEKEQKKRELFK